MNSFLRIGNNRITWIDNTRAWAICCVIFFHNFQFWGVESLPIILYVQLFNMPLFVIISGYCALESIKRNMSLKDLVLYNTKNFRRIYLPALSMGLGIFIIEKLLGHTPSIHILFNSYWFLTMLFVIMLISSCLWLLSRRIIQNNVMVLFIPLVFFSLIFIEPARIGEMIPFFLIGLLLKETNAIDRLLNKKWFVIVIIVATIVLLAVIEAIGILRTSIRSFYNYNFMHFLLNGTLYYWALRTFLSVLMCLSIISIIYRLSNSYTAFSWLGTQSLSLYVFSCIPLFIYNARNSTPMFLNNEIYSKICDNGILMYMANTITFLLTVFLCLFLSFILGKWKWTRLLFLGCWK